MSNIKTIYRKKPIFYNLFPYKISFKYMGEWRHLKETIINLLGYIPSMPTQRLTNEAFLYLSNEKDFTYILKQHRNKIREIFMPSNGYETMKRIDYKSLWYDRFPHAVKFNNPSKKDIYGMDTVSDWCRSNLLGPYYSNYRTIYVMTMTDALSIKLMFGGNIKEILQPLKNSETIKLLNQRCIEATSDLEYFKNG